jgi:hypothetical protein
MIGTIRKHSSWLWWLIAGLTIISFVMFMGSGPGRNRGGGGAGAGFGTIYGHELTAEEVGQAQRDFYLFYLINYGEWPDKNRSITPDQIEQQTYLNVLLSQKAKAMGVSVPDDVVADAAAQMLRAPGLTRALGTGGQPVPMDKFVEGVLTPKGFTTADFQHSVRSQLVAEQLRMVLGLSGSLVTPQEAGTVYDREHQEVSAQAVFFSASNYLEQVPAPADAVGTFFTNNLAYYRVPDRLQVSYVWFNVTNYLDQAKAEWAKTNFTETVDGVYRQYGATEFKDEKTPADAKAKIRDLLIKRRALSDAEVLANDFKTALYAMDPVKPENLATLAGQKGLTARISAPFTEGGQPEDFANAPAVMRAVSVLTPDSPFSDLIAGEDGIYLVGQGNQLPSFVPSFGDIHDRVVQDFRTQSAIALANKAGTNFYITASVQMAAGQSFAKAAVAAGFTPVVFSPFSLSSAEVPEADDRAPIRDLKEAAFTTAPGRVSRFMPTTDGGFVLYVQRLEPMDVSKKTVDLPGFIAQMRRGRESEAFNIWVNSEASREFRTIPALQKQFGAANQP